MTRTLALALVASAALGCSSEYVTEPGTPTTIYDAEVEDRLLPTPQRSPPPMRGIWRHSDVPLPALPPPQPTYVEPSVRVAIIPESRDPEDLRITSRLHSEIRENDSLSSEAKHVRIVSQGRHVILRGEVPTERERDEIDAMARSMPGVVQVDDYIVVTPE